MNIKELIKTTNYRLLDNYYNNNKYLKTYNVDISTHYIEYNSIMCITSINSDYHILMINNRIKLYYDNVKIYDNTISTPLKKYAVIMSLINKYLKEEAVY